MPRPVSPVLLLAPLCRDEIADAQGRTTSRAGGAGLYASWALARLGARAILHTALAERDRDLLQSLPRKTEVVLHPSRETTGFRIEVDPSDPNRRSLTLLAASDPLDPTRLGAIAEAAYAFLGPLLPGDLGGPLADALRGAAIPLDLGIQGLVRRVDESGMITPAALAGSFELPHLRVLAGDETEIAQAAGVWDAAGDPRALLGRLANEVIVTSGDRGASIFVQGGAKPVEVAAVPPPGPARHPIGLGDTFLAVYGWKRHSGLGPAEAGSIAAAAASDLLARGLVR